MFQLCDLGFDRDVALQALLDNRWSLDGALRVLLPDPEEPQAGRPSREPPPPAEILAPAALAVDERCSHACGRTRKHNSRVCCVHCPDGHTSHCSKRNRGSLAHRIHVQSRTADRAQASRPSAPLPPPVGSASTPPLSALWDRTICPICREACTSPQRSRCGHAMCLGCSEAMWQHGFELCPLCRELWLPEPVVQQAQENVVEYGYVVLGHLREWGHALGRHPVGWFELEQRLELQPGTLAGRLREHGLVLRHYSSVEMAQMWWSALGLRGTAPLWTGGA